MTMASLLFVVFCNDFRATHRRRQNKLRLASLSHDLTSAMARRYYCQPTNESLPQKQHEHVNDGSVNICVTSLLTIERTRALFVASCRPSRSNVVEEWLATRAQTTL